MPHLGAPLDSETSEKTGLLTDEDPDKESEMAPEEVEETLQELEDLADLDNLEQEARDLEDLEKREQSED